MNNTIELKNIVKELKNTELDAFQIAEFITLYLEGLENDFTIGDYRFINENYIVDIMKDELSCDEYIIGCFNDWFLADVTGAPVEIIEAAQSSDDGRTKLGEWINGDDKMLTKLCESYISADGAAHHFSHYDHSEVEISTAGVVAFRIDG